MRGGFRGKRTKFKHKIDLIARRYGKAPHEVAWYDWEDFYFDLEIAEVSNKAEREEYERLKGK
jgi:hypothetical protein